jgi:glyoxylate carboligase
MLRSTFQLTLLVFTLLFAQQGAMSHGISHTLAQQDQSAPHDTQCELCAAYAQIGGAVGSSDVRLSIDASTEPVATFYTATSHSTPFAAFTARAPPYSA